MGTAYRYDVSFPKIIAALDTDHPPSAFRSAAPPGSAPRALPVELMRAELLPAEPRVSTADLRAGAREAPNPPNAMEARATREPL
jgi:hypothetical protein